MCSRAISKTTSGLLFLLGELGYRDSGRAQVEMGRRREEERVEEKEREVEREGGRERGWKGGR